MSKAHHRKVLIVYLSTATIQNWYIFYVDIFIFNHLNQEKICPLTMIHRLRIRTGVAQWVFIMFLHKNNWLWECWMAQTILRLTYVYDTWVALQCPGCMVGVIIRLSWTAYFLAPLLLPRNRRLAGGHFSNKDTNIVLDRIWSAQGRSWPRLRYSDIAC